MDLVTKLIDAMIDYGEDSYWDDSRIIEKLLDCGVTQHDFERCGFSNFVREYFNNN